jgi:hypothetical protein
MKQKNLYTSKYLSIEWYYEGLFFGFGKIDNDYKHITYGLLIPFLIIEIHIPKKRKTQSNEL